MDEFEFPCPKCGESLISDEETAGTEAICPYCDKLIVMPDKAPVAPAPAAPAISPEKSQSGASSSLLPSRKQSGTPMPSSENIPADVTKSEGAPTENTGDPTHLPSGRSREAREDFDRLSAMAGGRQIDPLASTPVKGQISFHCPGCSRLIWIRPKDAGMVVNCAGCNQDVVCPQKEMEAKLLNAPASKKGSGSKGKGKTDLPSHRSADHLPAERMSSKREDSSSRTMLPSGPNRPGRTLTDSPETSPLQKTSVKPIPKQRDVEISPSELKRYRAASRERKIQRAITPHEELKSPPSDDATSGKTALPPSRGQSRRERSAPGIGGKGIPEPGAADGGHRLNAEHTPAFAAREELEQQMADASESADPWGNAQVPGGGGTRRLLILALVLGLPAIAAAAYFFLKNQDTASTVSVVDDSSNTSLDEAKAAENLLKKFLAAREVVDQLPLVRHPEVTEPRMQVHANQGHSQWPQVSKFGFANSGWINGKKFTGINVEFNDDSSRTAVFEMTPEGPKLDWESFVLFADPLMSEFVSTQPVTPGVYRVTCSLGDYYNFLYKDDIKYLCLDILGADEVSSCFGYADIDSEVAHELATLFAKEGQSMNPDDPQSKLAIKVMLKMHFKKGEDGESHSQAWIDAIESDSWMIP
ncbi:MAG: DNA-directed RNA polymerase subunit RPC12/RpoP [Verrucomicrobiales bacterium]|jgi:DNA-directed RNA polymerase subunit RPC12/RpoP